MTELKPKSRDRVRAALSALKAFSRRHPSLRYIITGVLAFVLIFLVGDSNLFNYLRNERRKAFIQSEYNRYRPQYEADSARLSDIRDNREHIERIARKQYYMHIPGEEVFILAPDSLDPSK